LAERSPSDAGRGEGTMRENVAALAMAFSGLVIRALSVAGV
jgi:hypothetical protein